MKPILLTIIFLIVSLLPMRADTIALWNFNSPTPDGLTSTGATQPVQGPTAGTASTVGGVSGDFVSGVTNVAADSSADNSGWQTSGYPAAGTSNKIAGVRFDVNTMAYQNIQLSWYQRNTATASKYFRLQYSVDGLNFLDANLITVSSNSTFLLQSADLSAMAGVKDNPNFAFRMVAEWESTAIGSGADNYAPVGTGSYGTSGTVRFDLVTVSGTVIPGANTAPTISTISNQTILVHLTSRPLPHTL